MGHARDQASQKADGLLGHLGFCAGFKLPVQFDQVAGKRFVWAARLRVHVILRGCRPGADSYGADCGNAKRFVLFSFTSMWKVKTALSVDLAVRHYG